MPLEKIIKFVYSFRRALFDLSSLLLKYLRFYTDVDTIYITKVKLLPAIRRYRIY